MYVVNKLLSKHISDCYEAIETLEAEVRKLKSNELEYKQRMDEHLNKIYDLQVERVNYITGDK